MSTDIPLTISFVKAYELQELIMSVGEWTPPPIHDIPIKEKKYRKEMIYKLLKK